MHFLLKQTEFAVPVYCHIVLYQLFLRSSNNFIISLFYFYEKAYSFLLLYNFF